MCHCKVPCVIRESVQCFQHLTLCPVSDLQERYLIFHENAKKTKTHNLSEFLQVSIPCLHPSQFPRNYEGGAVLPAAGRAAKALLIQGFLVRDWLKPGLFISLNVVFTF